MHCCVSTRALALPSSLLSYACSWQMKKYQKFIDQKKDIKSLAVEEQFMYEVCMYISHE